MSRKKIEVESINTGSHMNQNVTPSSNNNSESKKGNKNNNKVENLANQLKKTGFNREKTPSPVKKKSESTKTKSKNKTPSPVKKKSGSSTKTNSNIPRFSPGSALKSNGGVSSGTNITFSDLNATPNATPKKKASPKKKTPSKTRTLETIPSGQNITFNSTKAKTGVSSTSSGVSKMSIASTVVPSKKNEGSEYNSTIRNLKANINRLEKTWKRVGMPISTYRRQIANLQKRLGALENLKKQNKTPQKSKNTSLNTSSNSLRSYTSLEASVEKDRNRRQQQTPSPNQTPQSMSINSLRTPSTGSPMSINGSRVNSVGSGSSRRRYTGLRNTRRNLSYNMSQVVNAQAGESSREAENTKRSKNKDSKKKK
mgnify:CR=1 FL=1